MWSIWPEPILPATLLPAQIRLVRVSVEVFCFLTKLEVFKVISLPHNLGIDAVDSCRSVMIADDIADSIGGCRWYSDALKDGLGDRRPLDFLKMTFY
ncbi:MAG: hypothetical protein PHY09_15535 [Desulfuromonadaceae bacterium]|nr:hypothetical protein [Desulfuromonadaceae bacterium]MDD5105680.1 hypothetical protein [Desulfuromonadaceae bacterium]